MRKATVIAAIVCLAVLAVDIAHPGPRRPPTFEEPAQLAPMPTTAPAPVAQSGFRTSRTRAKAQVIIRTQENGEWQMFVFGPPQCPSHENLQVIWPADATQPLEIECDLLPTAHRR